MWPHTTCRKNVDNVANKSILPTKFSKIYHTFLNGKAKKYPVRLAEISQSLGRSFTTIVHNYHCRQQSVNRSWRSLLGVPLTGCKVVQSKHRQLSVCLPDMDSRDLVSVSRLSRDPFLPVSVSKVSGLASVPKAMYLHHKPIAFVLWVLQRYGLGKVL